MLILTERLLLLLELVVDEEWVMLTSEGGDNGVANRVVVVWEDG